MTVYHHRERWYAEHRAEDVALICAILREHRPPIIVELGTYLGGLAAAFADTAREWGGQVHTFDIARQFPSDLLEAFPNLSFHEESVLVENPLAIDLVSTPGAFLYCDNGEKERELACYAPHLAAGNIIGCHDWQTQVRPEFADPLLESLGYVPYRRPEFEAMANPVSYPISMTRLWRRERAA